MSREFWQISRRSFVGIGISAAASVILPAAARADATLDRIMSTGIVRVGIANEKPYGFVDTDGKLAGAVPDVILAALTPHGVKEMKAEIVEFSAMIPGLNADRFDIIGAGMYIKPARCEAIAFTRPVTRAGYGFVTLKGNPKGVKSVADTVKHADALVGTQSGSAQVETLAKAGVPLDRTVLFSNATEALAGLTAGRVDVIYFPGLELGELLKTANNAAVERVQGFQQIVLPTGEQDFGYGAMGLRKADTDLRALLDQEIGKMMESGKLLEIVSKYGYGKDELPTPSDTVEKLCKA